MPSSYSSNLLLELMADGENEGLWGDITNENLEILGRAAGGVGNITLAGTTHTLTVSQGQLSEGHYSTLVLGGSPTGTNTITISPNTVTRTFLVQNSSGQDAIFTQGSGGNVTVPNGGTAIVFCSGAGASSSVTDITADLLRGVNNLSDLDDPDTALQNLGLTATAAEINKLDGATLDLAAVTATAAEVNVLDGSTATTADLNKLADMTATAAEINKLDGFTGDTDDLNYAEELRATGVTAAEFNKLDGFTGTVDDLNYAKDLRATGVTTTEFDKLDGLTATTTELNYVDGVTSNIQTQINTVSATAEETVGVDQEWQDVSSLRSLDTSVENTYGKPIMVYLQGSRANVVEVSTDDSTWVRMGRLGTPGAFTESVSFVLPVGHYYIVRSASGSPSDWLELR